MKFYISFDRNSAGQIPAHFQNFEQSIRIKNVLQSESATFKCLKAYLLHSCNKDKGISRHWPSQQQNLSQRAENPPSFPTFLFRLLLCPPPYSPFPAKTKNYYVKYENGNILFLWFLPSWTYFYHSIWLQNLFFLFKLWSRDHSRTVGDFVAITRCQYWWISPPGPIPYPPLKPYPPDLYPTHRPITYP